jgi:AcrR family transcriptional regulator
MARIVKKPVERRNEFFDSAVRCFRKKGYYDTSVEDIAREVGVAKGLFYYYFKSKEDLMEQLVVKQWDEVEQDYIDIVDNDDLDAFAKFMRLSKASRERKVKTVYLWDVLENERDSLLVKRMTEEGFKRMIPLMVRIVEQGVREGVFDTPYPQEAVEFLMHGNESVIAANIADPAVFRRRMLASFDLMRRILGADQAMIDHIVEEAEAVFQAVADQMDKKKKDNDEKRSNGVDE